MKIIVALLIGCLSFFAIAQNPSKPLEESDQLQLKLMRRWVVFPFSSPSPLRSAADNAWWKVRERLTNTKKYLVASKNFLTEKDVFYPRKKLSPDDVRILSNLLDADVLVTGYSEGREFILNIYLAQSGDVFWTKELYFHPSAKPSDQLELVADKLMQEGLAVVPYQGFSITDPLITKVVYPEGNRKFSIIDVGVSDGFTEGTEVQWVDVSVNRASSPHAGHIQVTVVAEGKVAKVRKGVVVAEVLRAKNMDAVRDAMLVRFPKHAADMMQPYLKDAEKSGPTVGAELLTPIGSDNEGKRKNTVVFGSVLSFLGVLILAF